MDILLPVLEKIYSTFTTTYNEYSISGGNFICVLYNIKSYFQITYMTSSLKLIKLGNFRSIFRNFTLLEDRFTDSRMQIKNISCDRKAKGRHSFVDSQRCSEWRISFVISHFCVFDKAFNLFIVMMENSAYFN